LTSHATREHRVVVLPVPAPARISSGPLGWVAAAACSGLSRDSHGGASSWSGEAVANMCSGNLGRRPDGLQADRQNGAVSWLRALIGADDSEGWRGHARESIVDVNDGIVAAAGVAEGFARAGATTHTLLMAGVVV